MKSVPSVIPMSPELKTVPRTSGPIDQALAIAGAVYEITSTSIPSNMFIKKQIMMVANWSFEIGFESIKAFEENSILIKSRVGLNIFKNLKLVYLS